MRVVCLIQARLTSTRLPGKVLLKIGEYEVLWHVYQRCRSIFGDDTGVLIPYGTENEKLSAWCAERDIPHDNGPEEDVLSRYLIGAAVRLLRLEDYVVRVTADCPFVEPAHLRAIAMHAVHTKAVYVHSLGGPQGQSGEVILVGALYHDASAPAADLPFREHVTTLRRRDVTGLHPLGRLDPPADWGDWRWVLDTPEDYAWFQEIAQHVNTEPPHPTTEELCDLFARRPDLIRRNPV